MPDSRSRFYPPRTPWYAPARKVLHSLAVATRANRIPTPRQIPFSSLMTGLVVPGAAFAIHGRRTIGLSVLIAWASLFLLGIVFLGSGVANGALGLAMSAHGISVFHLFSPWLRDLTPLYRIASSLVTVGAVVVFGYLPLRELVFRQWAFPVATPSGAFVIQPNPNPHQIRRGDWIAHHVPRQVQNGFIIEEGTSFGPVLGLPGDVIEFRSDAVRVGGTTTTRLEGMPSSGTFTVPEDHWFVWLQLQSVVNRFPGSPEELASARAAHSSVAFEHLLGRPYSRWFFRRQSPLKS